MSDIPAARAELRAIAAELRGMRHTAEADRILAVVDGLMHRESRVNPPLPLHHRRARAERRADA